ncbi:MAG: transposase [Symploca sp. SIO1C2]|nr:transposase [Symploca sp. SIO1C2]
MAVYKGKYRVKSTRLPNRDYGANGWYFVTICTRNQNSFFGEVIEGQIKLSAIGKIAQQFWAEIPDHFEDVYIDAYVIMPNHIHGIVIIDKSNSPSRDVACNVSTISYEDDVYRARSQMSPKAGSLSVIIRSYKAAVSRWCKTNGYSSFSWQPRFYDHIIRTDGSLDRIREYIVNNPAKWEEDKKLPANLWM